jgi:phosphoribosylamine-glycine ligase
METPVYIAGAELHDNTLRTSGGRVLSVTGMAEDLPGARRKAYEAVERIEFEGKYYRRDIGAV